MAYNSRFHVEVAGKLATMYVVADIGAVPLLIATCDALPPEVEVLRVDLDGASELGKRELQVIDDVRTHWQATRRGPFRVSFAVRSRGDVKYEVRLGI